MSLDALNDLKPRARAKLPDEDHIRSVFACSVKNRDGLLVLADSSVSVVTLGGSFHYSAESELAWLAHDGRGAHTLRLYAERIKISFKSDADAERATREIRAAGDEARERVRAAEVARRQPLVLGSDDRFLPRCLFLGGVNVPVDVRAEVDLLFDGDDIKVHTSPAQHGREPVARLPYVRQFTVELSGPGRFTTGGGFVGGGFGLGGAVEGMAIAGILNSLTTRTRVVSVVALLSAEYEAFFLCQEYTPDELRRILAPVFLRARQLNVALGPSSEPVPNGEELKAGTSQPPVTSSPARTEQSAPTPVAEDLVGTLERLAALHRAGALSDAEFEQAKARALGVAT